METDWKITVVNDQFELSFPKRITQRSQSNLVEVVVTNCVHKCKSVS